MIPQPEIDASGKRFGRIRLERLLAQGGMGEVYADVDELLERPVAVKLMKAGLRLSAERRQGFLSEARVLSGLRHSNICAVHDFFEDQDQDVLVLVHADFDQAGGREFELERLEDALIDLERLDARQAEIVTLRFFGGLEGEEIAAALGISERTVKREWAMAKLWLYRELKN